MPHPTPKQRLLTHFQKKSENECWLWVGHKTKYGYGTLWMGRDSLPHEIHAHRAMFMYRYGPIPGDLQVCHKCDNPPCVNPHHLFLGDHKANALDRQLKGRNAPQRGIPKPGNRGSRNGMCRLTAEQIEEMNRLWDSGWTSNQLARRYGYTPSNIYWRMRQRKQLAT